MTTPEIPLPAQEDVRDLIGDLVSKTCQVEKVDAALPLTPAVPQVLAEYADADGALAAVVVADLPLAARTGAALVMMPPAVAEEAVEAGQLDGDLLDCVREVVNVLTRLLNGADTPHVTLRSLHRSGELLPGEVRALVAGHGSRRRDFAVTLEEYGAGHLAVLTRVAPEPVADAA